MANPEHLRILMQGVDAWNRWRQEDPSIEPDLDGADLREEVLIWANFGGSQLSWADFGGSDLRGSDISSADLSGAKLREASLHGVDLTWTDLDEADLNGAGLVGANLTHANLDKADFRSAVVGNTIFGAVDLSAAQGLDSVKHEGPSTIGLDTIYLSKGNIPEVFLRGAGVPEDFIVYMRSLVGKPIEFYSCFISYSSQDDEFARRLHADLQQSNVRCWFAPEDLKIGDKFRTRIDGRFATTTS